MRRLLRGPSLLAVLAIRGYQRSLGRLTGGRCRFHPTCSEYA
ncbi:MAG: membrane protein insertion efficiency factor YidD, partial [Actinobacteria bacterium]